MRSTPPHTIIITMINNIPGNVLLFQKLALANYACHYIVGVAP
jgi:hypothetical protein